MASTAALDTPHSIDLRPEAELEERVRSVVIVGGGFAGAALAYHLLAHHHPRQISLVEPRERIGRGIAYGVEHPALRLNVPAARMSLDPARPGDFVEFAAAHADPNAFLSRGSYGRYIDARLEQAQRDNPGRLQIVRATAVRVDGSDAGASVWLDDGRCLRADRVVLATGLAARSEHCTWPRDPRVVDAWDGRALSTLPRTGRILLLGSGLSAIDVLSVLASQGFSGETLLLSRRGLLPRPHTTRSGSFTLPARLGPPPRELTALFRWVRALVREAEAAGHPWQHAIDALRPRIPELWQRLSARDRLRFVRRVRPYWEVLRHRAPADALALIEGWKQSGALAVVTGEVLQCSAGEHALDLLLRVRGQAAREVREVREVIEQFTHVVRCTGPALELDPTHSPLTAALLRDGEARADCTRLGIATARYGQLLRPDGRPNERVFALGQLCRASRWETTSVPEIVRDSVALAQLFSQN